MDIDDNILEIGEIDFHGDVIKVYYDKYSDKNHSCNAIWRSRNPDSYYRGIAYMNNITGEITYPDDAIFPEQTKEDKEQIPIAVIVGYKNLTDIECDKIKEYLNTAYKRRNNIIT